MNEQQLFFNALQKTDLQELKLVKAGMDTSEVISPRIPENRIRQVIAMNTPASKVMYVLYVQ